MKPVKSLPQFIEMLQKDTDKRKNVSSQKVGGMNTTDWEKNRFIRLTQFVPSLVPYQWYSCTMYKKLSADFAD